MKRRNLTIHRGLFITARTEIRILMAKSKSDFYNSKIVNSKLLFKGVDRLLHSKWLVLPFHASKQSLADDFAKHLRKGFMLTECVLVLMLKQTLT